MNLVPKRKVIINAQSQDQIETLETTIRQTIENDVDRRNLGYFDYRLRIPVGIDKYEK